MKKHTLLKLIIFLIILFIIYVKLTGFSFILPNDFYRFNEDENKFKERYDSINNIYFRYGETFQPDLHIHYIDIYDDYGIYKKFPKTTSKPNSLEPSFLKINNIKMHSDSTFNEFMKVYNGKGSVDTLKFRFVTKYDTTFAYKVESRWHYFWKNTVEPIFEK
jgi:hypothetical protein